MIVERRSGPGTFRYMNCGECSGRYVIAGRKSDRGDAVVARVACPECHAEYEVALPPQIAAPFRLLTPRDPMRRDD